MCINLGFCKIYFIKQQDGTIWRQFWDCWTNTLRGW